MKNHKSTLLIVLLLLMGQGVYAQTVYYVDSASGNDSYSGNSPATAWRTLSHAGDSADSGAVVYIRAGTYGSWHPHSYTSWIRYPGDDQPVVTVYGGTGLNLDSRTDVLVKGLKFQGCDTAVKGTDATNCEIRECTIDYAGVYATASYTPIGHFDRCNYLYWIRDTAYAPGNNEYNGTRDSTQDGIHIEGCHYTLIDSCDFSDASHYLITPANADSTEEQPDRRDNLWTVVRHSNLHDAHGMLAPFSSSSYHLIEDNLLDNWQTWQDRAGAHLHLYSNYAIVRYNLVRHNLSNPVTQGPGNVNPVVDIWTDQYQSARHNHLYNNTIIATSPYSKTLFERVEGGSGVYLDYNVLKNNIFYGGYAGDPAIKYTYRYRGGHYSNWTHFTDSLATNLITSATTA